jgi:uncharacterized protein (DUF433 family)
MKSSIVSKKTVLGGKPVIAGTRISVDLIATYLATGYDLSDIRQAYPHLTKDQIEVALTYIHDAASRQIKKLEATRV